MLIEYNHQITPQDLINIKDVGQCAIEGTNDDGLYFYLIVVTTRGYSSICTFGPVIPDIDEVVPGYTCQMHQVEFNPKKITKDIYTWLNGKKPGKAKPISSAKIICVEEALDNLPDIAGHIYQNKLFDDIIE